MRTLLLTSLTIGAALTACAQQRVSPHETVAINVAGKKITVDYGRPYLKGRKAVGGQLVPFGAVWRTGADEATVLTTEADLDIGGLKVSKGTYALFTLPTEKEWKLIVNKTAKQWGAFSYKESDDLGRAAMKMRTLAQPVEQFTIVFEPAGGNRAMLKMSWEKTEVAIPIIVM